MPFLDGLEVGLVVEAGRWRGGRSRSSIVEVGIGPAPGVGTVDRGVALAGISTSLGILLVVKVGGQSVLGNLVHFTGSDLNLERPVDAAPPRRGGVVQTLISIGLGTVDVVLEPTAVLVEVGLPVLGAQTLNVVAHGPLPRGGDVVGFVARFLLGIQNDPQRQRVGDVEQPRGTGLEDLAPQAVGFLDAGADHHIIGGLGEGRVGVEDALDVLGDPTEDAGHALPDGEGVRVVGVAVGVVIVDHPGFPSQVHDAVVLAAVLQTEGGALQLVFQAMHAQPTGEGRIDVQGVAGLPDLFRCEGGGGRWTGVAGGLQTPQAVQTGRGADGQRAPIARLGEEEVLHVDVGVLAVDDVVGIAVNIMVRGKMMMTTTGCLGAEGGVRHGLSALETGRVGGNLIGLVVVGCVHGHRGLRGSSSSSTTMTVRVGKGALRARSKGLGGPLQHLDALPTAGQQGRSTAKPLGGLALSDIVALAVMPDGRHEAGNAHLHGIHQNMAEFRRPTQFGLVAGRAGFDGG